MREVVWWLVGVASACLLALPYWEKAEPMRYTLVGTSIGAGVCLVGLGIYALGKRAGRKASDAEKQP